VTNRKIIVQVQKNLLVVRGFCSITFGTQPAVTVAATLSRF